MQLTVGSQQFTFNSLEAVFDTSTQGITCNFRVEDRSSNSSMDWEILSGSKWIKGNYEYPGELFPGKSVVFFHLQTYTNRVPGTYTPNNDLKMVIDEFENGRIHGTFKGKLFCYTCNPYGTIVDLTNGEFEMPFTYR